MAITPTRKRNPSANVEMAIESLTIKPSENGGFSVECRKEPKSTEDKGMGYTPPKTYTFESLDGLVDFLSGEFGDGEKSAADTVYEDD